MLYDNSNLAKENFYNIFTLSNKLNSHGSVITKCEINRCQYCNICELISGDFQLHTSILKKMSMWGYESRLDEYRNIYSKTLKKIQITGTSIFRLDLGWERHPVPIKALCLFIYKASFNCLYHRGYLLIDQPLKLNVLTNYIDILLYLCNWFNIFSSNVKKNSVNTFLRYYDDYKVIKLICDCSVK